MFSKIWITVFVFFLLLINIDNMVDELCGHEDGPLFLVNINNNLASAGYDC